MADAALLPKPPEPHMIAIMSDLHTFFRDQGVGIRVRSGTELFRIEDPVTHLFLLREGSVALFRTLEDGSIFILHRAAPGDLVAEASYFADRYRCGARTEGDCLFWRVERASLGRTGSVADRFLDLLAPVLARRLHEARARAEILSRRGVAARLDAWLTLNGGELPAKGNWLGLAAEISVSPEALYRELSRRRGAVRNATDPRSALRY